jgi:hypothetical protein
MPSNKALNSMMRMRTAGILATNSESANRETKLTGVWGFVEELSFVVVPLLLLLVVLVFARRTSTGEGGFSLKGTIVLIILVLLPAISSWRFAREVKNHLFLHSLTSEQIASFIVGTQEITGEREKAALTQALNQVQWFSPHHGGWAEPVDLRIRLKSGNARRLRLALYLKEPGVVVDFGPAPGQGGLHAGYGFCKSLPSVLSEIGVKLPAKLE